MNDEVEPHLGFSTTAWRKMRLYTDLCPWEVSGLGLLDEVDSGYVMTDLLLVEQEVTSLATALDGRAVSDLISRLLDAGEDPSRLKVWWHSHAREAVFWSGEDERTISTFQNDYMLSIVSNHARKHLARVDRYAPRTTTWVWVDPPDGADDPGADEVAAARSELEAVVRRIA